MNLLTILEELWEVCNDAKYDSALLLENGDHCISAEKLENKLFNLICRIEEKGENE